MIRAESSDAKRGSASDAGRSSLQRGERTQQLRVGYRGGPLAIEGRTTPGRVRAGDRAPDGLVPGGRLFDRFAPARFTALTFGGARVEPRRGLDVVDAASAARAYDVRGDAIALVRPDGYIGAWADDARSLERALDLMVG